MEPSNPSQKVYWFASRSRFLNSVWFRWYPINLQGFLAVLLVLGGYICCVSLFFVSSEFWAVSAAFTLFVVIQIFTAYLMFRKTKALDI